MITNNISQLGSTISLAMLFLKYLCFVVEIVKKIFSKIANERLRKVQILERMENIFSKIFIDFNCDVT